MSNSYNSEIGRNEVVMDKGRDEDFWSSDIAPQDREQSASYSNEEEVISTSDPNCKLLTDKWLYFHGFLIDRTLGTFCIHYNLPRDVFYKLSSYQLDRARVIIMQLLNERVFRCENSDLAKYAKLETYYLKFGKSGLVARKNQEIPAWDPVRGKRIQGLELVISDIRALVYIDETYDHMPIPQQQIQLWNSSQILQDCYSYIQYGQEHSEIIRKSLNLDIKFEGIYLYLEVMEACRNKLLQSPDLHHPVFEDQSEMQSKESDETIICMKNISLFYEILLLCEKLSFTTELIDNDNIITKLNILKPRTTNFEEKREAWCDLIILLMSEKTLLLVQLLVPYLVNFEDSSFLNHRDSLQRLKVLINFAKSVIFSKVDPSVITTQYELNEKLTGWRILQFIYNEMEEDADQRSEIKYFQESRGVSNHQCIAQTQIASKPVDADSSWVPSKEEVNKYVEKTNGKNVYTCTYNSCGKQFRSNRGILPHVRSHLNPLLGNMNFVQVDYHHQGPDENKMFICTYNGCMKSSGKLARIRRHIQSHINSEYNLPQPELDQYWEGPDVNNMYTCTYDGCMRQFEFHCSVRIHVQQHLNKAIAR